MRFASAVFALCSFVFVSGLFVGGCAVEKRNRATLIGRGLAHYVVDEKTGDVNFVFKE